MFTNRELKRADQARILYRCIGMPGYSKFIRRLENGSILNCPITGNDVKRAIHVYGPDVATLKGWATRNRPKQIGTIISIPMSRDIIDRHPTTTVSIDYMFVQGLCILHTTSTGYEFKTIEYIPGKKGSAKTSLKGILRVIKKFKDRGIRVTQVNGDSEFECITKGISPTSLNIVGKGERVGNIERSNKTTKGGSRCTIHSCPYEWYPKAMVKACVTNVTRNHNEAPSTNGYSDTLGPGTLVAGTPKPDYNVITKLMFVAYVQVHQMEEPTNNQEARTLGVIALHPSRNAQGS